MTNESKTVPSLALDTDAVLAKMSPADRARFIEAGDRYQQRGARVRADLKQTEAKKWAAVAPGGDHEGALVHHVRVTDALGTTSNEFVDVTMGYLLTLWDANGGVTEKAYNSALAVLDGVKPENETEAMLVAQMIAANESAMCCAAMIGKAFDANTALGYGNLANKFMRTYAAQVEALAKLRRGGEQVVKYIHVHEGGQAVVAGTINQEGGRRSAKGDGQPRTKDTAEAVEGRAALPCPDPARDGMPLAGHAERAVPHAWRAEPGGAEGE